MTDWQDTPPTYQQWYDNKTGYWWLKTKIPEQETEDENGDLFRFGAFDIIEIVWITNQIDSRQDFLGEGKLIVSFFGNTKSVSIEDMKTNTEWKPVISHEA
jgi:hypothetical protein